MPTNIKQPAYSLLIYPSIELSFYSSSKGSLQLHQLATMIHLYIVVTTTPLTSFFIQLLVYSRHFFPFDFENEYIRCRPEFNCKRERINSLLFMKGLKDNFSENIISVQWTQYIL